MTTARNSRAARLEKLPKVVMHERFNWVAGRQSMRTPEPLSQIKKLPPPTRTRRSRVQQVLVRPHTQATYFFKRP
jgi:hypothetical protein